MQLPLIQTVSTLAELGHIGSFSLQMDDSIDVRINWRDEEFFVRAHPDSYNSFAMKALLDALEHQGFELLDADEDAGIEQEDGRVLLWLARIPAMTRRISTDWKEYRTVKPEHQEALR